MTAHDDLRERVAEALHKHEHRVLDGSPLPHWALLRADSVLDAIGPVLTDGRMALARAVGLLEAHWEVCADPFPDASLRRALDRMEAANSPNDTGGDSDE